MTDANIQDDTMEIPTEYPDEEEEPSLQEAFAKLWKNEKCHDVVLKSSDGVEVPANRYALAMRCKYFDTMLLGGYNESKSGVVESQYPGLIVKSVAEYLHTGDAGLLGFVMDEKVADVTAEDVQRVHELVLLTVAASYYSLPVLRRKVHKCILKVLSRFPCLSLTLLQACRQNDQATSVTELKSIALTSIRSFYSTVALNETVCGSLSEATIAEVLQDDKLQLDESTLFELVRLWSCGEPNLEEPLVNGRKSIASNLIKKHICLEKIDPELLKTTVADSGLVTMEQRFAAFEEQAVAAKKQYGIDFKKPRFTPPDGTWKSSISDVVTLGGKETGVGDLLSFPPVTANTNELHTWTIKIEEADEGAGIWLGIVHAAVSYTELSSTFLANHKFSWGFTSDGKAWLRGKEGEYGTPQFHVGEEVTLNLDLRAGDLNGFLQYGDVKRGRIVYMIEKMTAVSDEGAAIAVSVSAGSKARFRFIRHSASREEA